MPSNFNYTKIATTAKRLVTKFGRSVTLVKFDETPDDSSKPWRGDLTPRVDPEATVALDAAFVEPSGLASLGWGVEKPDFVDRSVQILIVAPGPTLLANLEDYDEVIDGSTRWKVTGVQILKPGLVTLMYFIGVGR